MDNLTLLLHIPVLSLQLIINGLLIGGIFALSAFGLALVWGVMNVINVAQGEFVMLGGYIVWALFKVGVNPVLGIPLAAVIMSLVVVVLYRLAIFRVVGHDFFISILATFGLRILIPQLLNHVFVTDLNASLMA